MQTYRAETSGSTAKELLAVVGLLVAIVASGVWIYCAQIRRVAVNVPLQQAVGEALADETARVIGHRGKVVLVTAQAGFAPEIKVQVEAFERQLKHLGGTITVKETLVLDPGDNPKYRPGAGLSAKRFLKIARKHSDADAIVSFVGAPALSEAELGQLKSPPKLIAETHSPEKLAVLLQKKVLLAAVVPRYEFPAPGPAKPRTSRDWFNRYFQVISTNSPPPQADGTP